MKRNELIIAGVMLLIIATGILGRGYIQQQNTLNYISDGLQQNAGVSLDGAIYFLQRASNESVATEERQIALDVAQRMLQNTIRSLAFLGFTDPKNGYHWRSIGNGLHVASQELTHWLQQPELLAGEPDTLELLITVGDVLPSIIREEGNSVTWGWTPYILEEVATYARQYAEKANHAR